MQRRNGEGRAGTVIDFEFVAGTSSQLVESQSKYSISKLSCLKRMCPEYKRRDQHTVLPKFPEGQSSMSEVINLSDLSLSARHGLASGDWFPMIR